MGTRQRTIGLVAILLAGAAALCVPAAAFEGPRGSKGAPAAQQKGKAAPAPAPGQPQQGQQPQQGNDSAASAEDAAKDKNKAAETAARMLDAGIKAYEAGKTKDAVRLFDTLLQGSSITHPQMAQALYYRGLSRRKENKPGLAISDLTAAIWLKDGLGPAEKQEAMRQRVAAYQEAGIGDVPDFGPPPDSGSVYAGATPGAPLAPSGATGGSPGASWQTAMGSTAPPPAAYAAPAAPQAAPPPSSGSSGGFFSSITNFFTGGPGSTGSPPPAPPAAAPPATPGAYPGEVTTASINETKPAAVPSVANSWSQSVSPGAAPPASSEALPWQQHATAAPAPAQPAAQPAAQPQGETLPWSTSGTSVAAPAATGYAPAPAPVAAAGPMSATPVAATPVATKAATPAASYVPLKGKYKIQVGAVRSREEADLMVAKLLTEHGGELGGRDPKIDQAPIGNMGTFYRVRVGPYANASEPKSLCGALKTSGFDCLVVTN